MIVKKIAFGDSSEAFIEERLSDNVNIIYSNDNNKGKTLLIQGLMYSIGNDPIFPTGFDYLNYYFYSQIEFKKRKYDFLRKNKTIIVKDDKNFYQVFESVSELKYWLDSNLFSLPKIVKNNEEKMVDLFLFYQLFFIGQDKRNTSNIQKNGYYNKTDYLNMLSSLNGSYQSFSDDIDIETIRNDIKRIKSEIAYLKKQMKFVSNNPDIASYTLSSSDKEDQARYKNKLNEIVSKITKYKNQRARETNRVTLLENLLTELNSLNRNIEIGKVKCAECGSDKIIYTNGDVSFEITNSVVKKKIQHSINEQINMKNDIIHELTVEIENEQIKQKELYREVPQKVQNLLAFSEEILSDDEYNKKIVNLEQEIAEFKDLLKSEETQDGELKELNRLMMDAIISKMNSLYHDIDPDGRLSFQKLFTINDENYSGSEGQEFYFCKLLSLDNYFNHDFPIIIDSFRSGELSTTKEKAMIDIYKKIKKQVILTSTVKDEEYEKLKYNQDKELNSIDYSAHINSRILQEKYADAFVQILKSFEIET